MTRWLVLGGSVLALVVTAEVVRQVLTRRVVGRWPAAALVARRCVRPGFAVAALIGIEIGLAPDMIANELEEPVRQVVAILLIASITWLIVQAAYASTDLILVRLEVQLEAQVRSAQRTHTQVTVMRRVVAAVGIVVGVGAALFTFPAVRALGAGLLASAGIAGVVAGVAARSAIGNLFAGIQLAFSDALRLADVVTVNGEWGRIEEMTLTYVVVRLWDERRLILPVSYFTENPFENWSRHEGPLLGTVFLRVDWGVPVHDLRTELHRYLQDNPLWDRRDWNLSVTDVADSGFVELRAVMSAWDSSSLWDLRCDVREHLVGHVREKYPQFLPRLRAEVVRDGSEPQN